MFAWSLFATKNIRISYLELATYFTIIYLFVFELMTYGFPILLVIDFLGGTLQRGGAVVLAEDLTHLQLDQTEKTQLVAVLYAYRRPN